MRKYWRIIVCFLLIFSISAAGFAASYVGNKNSRKFHLVSCRWANQMKQENKVTFASRQEAVSANYIACKVCNP